MKKKESRKKLSLPNETVRALRAVELGRIAGGMYSDEASCYPAYCDPEWP